MDESAPEDVAADPDARIDFTTFHEGYVRHYIALADQKAGVAFSLSGALLAFLFSRPSFSEGLLTPDLTSGFVVRATAVGLLLGCIAAAVFVITPRTTGSSERLVFFGKVAEFKDADAYLSYFSAQAERDLLEARVRHCYDISKICARKYTTLRKSIGLGLLGGFEALAVVALLS